MLGTSGARTALAALPGRGWLGRSQALAGLEALLRPWWRSEGWPGLGEAAGHASRLPGGHPEGYLEGFAQIYADMAEQISARLEGRAADGRALLVPGIAQGLRGMRFIAAAVASSASDAAWTEV